MRANLLARARQLLETLEVLPFSQKWPCKHGPEHSRLFWPTVAPNRPGAQASGTDVPDAHAKPSGHGLHSSLEARLVALEYVPALQPMAMGVPRGHCKTENASKGFHQLLLGLRKHLAHGHGHGYMGTKQTNSKRA